MIPHTISKSEKITTNENCQEARSSVTQATRKTKSYPSQRHTNIIIGAQFKEPLWDRLQAKLKEQYASLSDFDEETDWHSVCKELGFSALQTGQLVKLIKAQQSAHTDASGLPSPCSPTEEVHDEPPTYLD